MDLLSAAQHVHKPAFWSWELEITPLAALPKAVLTLLFFFDNIKFNPTYCSREKEEPSYDK